MKYDKARKEIFAIKNPHKVDSLIVKWAQCSTNHDLSKKELEIRQTILKLLRARYLQLINIKSMKI